MENNSGDEQINNITNTNNHHSLADNILLYEGYNERNISFNEYNSFYSRNDNNNRRGETIFMPVALAGNSLAENTSDTAIRANSSRRRFRNYLNIIRNEMNFADSINVGNLPDLPNLPNLPNLPELPNLSSAPLNFVDDINESSNIHTHNHNDYLDFANYFDLLDHHSLVLNENRDRISDMLRSKQKYGKLVFITYRKLYENNLVFFTLLNESIYRKITDTYFNLILKEEKNISLLFKNTKTFISCLPKLNKILKICKKVDLNDKKIFKEALFFKICLDIYEDYLKKMEKPLYEVLYIYIYIIFIGLL
jgi:hypothetical protein